MFDLTCFLAGCATALPLALLALSLQRRRQQARTRLKTRKTLVLGETQSLQELAESLGRKLATLASGVEGHAQLLCESLGEPQDIADQAERLWEAVRRLRFFSEKMQSFARIPRLETAPTDIHRLLSAVSREVEDYARGSLKVSLDIAPSLPMAMADAEALRTALLFLIEGVLSLEPNATNLILQGQIQMQGDEDIPRVRLDIEAFMDEAEPEAGRESREVLFSYAAARNLLEAQSARLTLDHSPGLSAVASLSLEATATPAEEVTDAAIGSEFEPVPLPPPLPLPLTGPHSFGGVLIMEGNPAIREMLTRELGRTSRNVIACADGVAARSLYMATPERFELLILEQSDRRIRGDVLARAALRENPGVKVLLLEPGPGRSLSELQTDALPTGGKDLFSLHKPFGIMELRNVLCRILGPEPEALSPAPEFQAQPL